MNDDGFRTMWSSFLNLARRHGFSQQMINDAAHFAAANYRNNTRYKSERARQDAVRGFMASRHWPESFQRAVLDWDDGIVAHGIDPQTGEVAQPQRPEYSQQQPTTQAAPPPIQQWATQTAQAIGTEDGYRRYWSMARDPATDQQFRIAFQAAADVSGAATSGQGQPQPAASAGGGDAHG